MIGAVFRLEWLNACRNGKHHRFRLVFLAVLLAEFAFLLVAFVDRDILGVDVEIDENLWLLGRFWFYYQLFTWQNFVAILLLAPAFSAGSIGEEKSRASLPLLLTTQLRASEIILGRWLGQCTQVLVLVVPAVPLQVLLGTINGITPALHLGLFTSMVLLAMLLTAIGMLTSVLCRRTATAVILLYALVGGILATLWLSGWQGLFVDYLLYPIRQDTARVNVSNGLMFIGVIGGITVACLAVASIRLRPTAAKHFDAPPRPLFRWLPRRRVSEKQPVRWKERYAGDVGVFHFLSWIPQRMRVVLVGFTAALPPLLFSEEGSIAANLLLLFALAEGIGIRCSSSIPSEMDRQTWDGLLVTSLSNHEIVRGRLWGALDRIVPFMFAFVAVSTTALLLCGYFWAVLVTVLGWSLAWMFCYFYAAVGVYQSLECRQAWQSMVKFLVSSITEPATYLIITGMIGGLIAAAISAAVAGLLSLAGLSFNVVMMTVMPVMQLVVWSSLLFIAMSARSEELLEKAHEIVNKQRRDTLPKPKVAEMKTEVRNEEMHISL